MYRDVDADVDYFISRRPAKKLLILLSKDGLEGWLADIWQLFIWTSTVHNVVFFWYDLHVFSMHRS